MMSLPREEYYERVLDSYITDYSKVALLFDYDGTLSPIVSHPTLAVLPAQTRKLLMRLSNMMDVHVAIISGKVKLYVILLYDKYLEKSI